MIHSGVLTFNNIPEKDGRRLLIGWLSNWQYADKTPTTGWRSSQGFPRELHLHKTPASTLPVLYQQAPPELRKLRTNHFDENDTDVLTLNTLLQKNSVSGTTAEIYLDCEIPDGQLEIKLRKSKNHETLITYDRTRQELVFERTKSGETAFSATFPGRFNAPLLLLNNRLKLRIFMDRSVIEIFAGEGEKVMTFQVFPDEESTGIEITGSPAVKISEFDWWNLTSIWEK